MSTLNRFEILNNRKAHYLPSNPGGGGGGSTSSSSPLNPSSSRHKFASSIVTATEHRSPIGNDGSESRISSSSSSSNSLPPGIKAPPSILKGSSSLNPPGLGLRALSPPSAILEVKDSAPVINVKTGLPLSSATIAKNPTIAKDHPMSSTSPQRAGYSPFGGLGLVGDIGIWGGSSGKELDNSNNNGWGNRR